MVKSHSKDVLQPTSRFIRKDKIKFVILNAFIGSTVLAAFVNYRLVSGLHDAVPITAFETEKRWFYFFKDVERSADLIKDFHCIVLKIQGNSTRIWSLK